MRCPTQSELPPPPPGKAGWPWTEESPQLPDTMPDGTPWPRVSIITPSFNQVQFLEETIRTVLLQGYPDIEYIIMDGGSADGSVELIAKYAPWLARWVSEPDRGQSHALNKGFREATGLFVGWINSDDVYTPGAIVRAAQFLAANPRTVAVYSDAAVIDADGMPIGRIPAVEMDVDALLLGNYIPQPTLFMQRDALLRAGPLDEAFHYSMDHDLCFRLAAIGELRRLDYELARFRLCPSTKSGSNPELFGSDTLLILGRLFDDPGFAAAHAHMRDRAYARVFWQRGIRCLVKGVLERGADDCHKALTLRILDRDSDFAVDMIVVDPSTIRPRSQGLIVSLLSALPFRGSQHRALSAQVWQAYWSLSFYQSHRDGARRRILASAAHLLYGDPYRIKDRGFRSITAQALLGRQVTRILRPMRSE